ncbi:MAG: GNAT family N-acetyltransferase [Clostridia bacterium]|nr:GNAT family N-acetyltransferase [Clostridia bacterium]
MYLKKIEFAEIKRDIGKRYQKDFPSVERMPLFIWKKHAKNGIMETYKIIDEEKEVAYIVFSKEKEKCMLIYYFAVYEEFRNDGYGSKVMQLLKEKVFKGDYDIIFLEVDKRNHGKDYKENKIRERRVDFYTRNGFQLIDVLFENFGVSYEFLAFYDENKLDRKTVSQIVYEKENEFYSELLGKKMASKNIVALKGDN